MLFKKCTRCGFQWLSREQWLGDPQVQLIGYQANYKALQTGILLFNHSCRTTLALQAPEFVDLYDGPVFAERLQGEEQCPGYCQHQRELAACPQRCECAYIREILQVIRRWPKEKTAAAAPGRDLEAPSV